MADINALIANPQVPMVNLGAAAQGANQVMQVQQNQQKMQSANALRGILSAPGAIDPETGQLHPDALQKVMGIDPQVGMTLQTNGLAMQQKKLQMDALKTKSAYDSAQYVGDNMAGVYEQYADAVKDGKTSPDKALSDAREAWTKTLEEMKTSGVVGPDVLKHVAPTFEPKDFQSRIQNNESFRKWNKDQRDQEKLTQQEKQQNRRDDEIGTTMGKDVDGNTVIFRPNAPPDKQAVYPGTNQAVPPEKLAGATKMGTGPGSGSAATQDRSAVENVARNDYEKELGHPVDVKDPAQKAELDRRVLAAEDKRKTELAGSSAGAKVAATGGNDRLAQQKVVRQNLETEYGRPLTPADDAEVDKRLLAAEDARKAAQAGATTTARTAAQQALAKPVPVMVNGVRQDAIWKDGKYYDVDGKTPIEGKVIGASRTDGKKTPGQEAEDDAMAIAEKRVTAKEAELGHPLDQAERAEIRQAARLDPKIQEAARKLDATAIGDDAAKLIAEETLKGDWHATVGMGRNQASMRKIAEWRSKLATEQGLSGSDLAANTAEFNGIMAAERVLGTRGAGIDLGIAEAQKFAPMVLQLSDKVNRTQFPTFNSLQLAVEKGTGGEDVVRLVDALNAYKMAYTQILTRGGMPTDDSRRRSDEVIDKAWSNGQIHAALDQLNQEMNGARSAVPEVRDNLYKALTGKTRVTPVELVPSPTQSASPARPTASQGNPWQPGQPIPAGAIETLKTHPTTAATFDKHFGTGEAAKILGTGPAAPAASQATPAAPPQPSAVPPETAAHSSPPPVPTQQAAPAREVAPIKLTPAMKEADLIDKQVYDTSRGRAVWDAEKKKFFPVEAK